jgi:hypothetical protein
MVRLPDVANYVVGRVDECIDVRDGGEWRHGRITPIKCFGLGRDIASTMFRPFSLFYRETPVNRGVFACREAVCHG